RVLTTGDIVELIRRLVVLPVRLNVPEDSKDYAADAIIIPRTEIEHDLDEYEHFGNRRLRTVGELIQEAFRIGLYRMERVVRERPSRCATCTRPTTAACARSRRQRARTSASWARSARTPRCRSTASCRPRTARWPRARSPARWSIWMRSRRRCSRSRRPTPTS